MDNRFIRSEIIIGKDTLDTLKNKKVLLFGVGGVGGYALEMMARLGISNIDIVDADEFSLSNLNRQILATEKTIGKRKVDVAKERVLSINNEAHVNTFDFFYLPETKNKISLKDYDLIIDAIDTVCAKLNIIKDAFDNNIKIISCMGTGNRTDPTKLIATDIFNTKNDPLSKVMRHELRKRGVDKLLVVTSTQNPIKPSVKLETEERRKDIPGSVCFVPAAAGVLLAYEAYKLLLGIKD